MATSSLAVCVSRLLLERTRLDQEVEKLRSRLFTLLMLGAAHTVTLSCMLLSYHCLSRF